jgi:hypothetical protein
MSEGYPENFPTWSMPHWSFLLFYGYVLGILAILLFLFVRWLRWYIKFSRVVSEIDRYLHDNEE